MEGSCSGTSERSWEEDDFTDLLLPRFLKEMLDEDLCKHQGEENCEQCPQNTHSESAQLRWDLPGTDKFSTLSGSDWESIVSDAKDGQCFFNAYEDTEIKRATTDSKKECDLLSGESTLFKNLRWQVLFSDNFRKSFQQLRFSSTKKLVINLLLKLARGWRPRKVNVDWKCENSSYIMKQFKVDIYCVVCSVDIMKDSIYKQVLKVWDILPMTDTTKLLKRLDSIASLYTDEFINHCNEKLFERNFEVPLSWSLSSDIFRFKNLGNTKLDSGADTGSDECRTYAENSKISESLLLVKFYPMSSCTVSHLLSDVEGKDAGLTFEVTDEEREIICYTRSCFILGRSGTGKTTTLTRKLYQTFQKYCIASQCSRTADSNLSITDEVDGGLLHGGSVIRQIFVTVSPKLCHAVKKSLAQLQSIATENVSGENNFNGVDDVDEVSEFKDIPDAFVGIRQEKYPLVITFQKFLMMLDGTLGKSYFQRFPYVRDSFRSEGRKSVALQTFLRKNEVTYDRFFSLYWPHFNTKLTRGLDASRVFTEIMSHIKGGPLEGEACNFNRSRQEYISLSESRISTLSVDQRRAIYDIYKDYEKIKMKRGEFDLADFVSDIHLRLKNEDLQGDKMDFVYIDEVQDLTMRQISLFRYICNNVDEGFVFSGDTAQTIARGIDFRFEDIRSLFYNEFLQRPRISDLSRKKEKGLISDMFNLSHNFRTHTGVLRLAQSVVDLICYYFPYSIDVLAPETSHIHGESPIFLEPGSDENLIVSIFGHSETSSGKWVGFGADQVILVRDDSAKKEISKFIGQQALVLTILECKGLEFQDVLLYNFFGSSPLSNQWRTVYEFLIEKDLLVGDSVKSFPSFCQSRHNLLCSELKQLYVAITRTRQRLWICENNIEVSKPMLDYWRMLSLVQVTEIDATLAETMHRASTPEEWKLQGIKLFWEKNYEMAKMCFEKAGDETWEKRAKASGLRAAADSLCGLNPEEGAMMLREAAEIFDSLDRVESAAECFCELGEYERAGRIYLDKCGKSELRKAGECFSLAGKHELAAEVYESGNFLRDCLSACAKGNHVDLGLQYIEKWKQQALSNNVIRARLVEIDKIVQEFLESYSLECHKAKDSASLMKAVRSFCSTESKCNVLKSLDCLEELLVLEEELGNFNEASEIAKSLGDALREADLLEKAGRFSNACLLILSYVISNVLWVSGNQGWPLKSFPQKLELLNRVMSIAQKVSETFHASVCAQARILLYDQNNLSELMQFYNASKQYETPIGEILVLRKLLDVHFKANVTKYAWDNGLELDPRTFDQRMAQNQVSVGALVHLWNLWKARSLEISECLECLEKTDSIKLEGVAGFCFNFFGLRLLDNSSVTFQLLNPDAAWVKNVEGFIRLNRNVETVKACQFAWAARKFWLQELVFVGLKVLDALQNLSRSPVAKRSVQYCQGMCLLHIFDIANFFLDLKSIKMTYTDNRKLQDLLQLCMRYLSFVFTPDPRASLHQQMLAFRETELSRNLLEECILRQLSGRREFSYYHIGAVVMTMLGNGKLKNSFYEKFAEKSSNNPNPFWKLVIENIRQTFEPDSVKESKFGTVRMQEYPLTCSVDPLCQSLLWALVLTSKAGNYMCPPCCLYLLERLLILAPHPHGFFFTTKSSFVEYLISLPPDASRKTGSVTYNEFQTWVLVDFVRFVVEEVLDSRINTHAWLKNYKISYDSYFPVLVLRMFMILCLLSLNWDFPLDLLKRLLTKADMKSQLPKEFYEAIRPKRRGYIFESAVATAFKLISDPLVIVIFEDVNREFKSPDAIVVDLKSFSCKSDIMKVLFPRRTKASPDQPTTSEGNVTSISIAPFFDDEGKNTIAESPEVASKSASHSNLENGNGNLRINWDIFRELSEAFKSCTDRNDEHRKSLLLGKKVEVEDHMNSITSAVSQLIEQSSHSVEEKDLPYDVGRLIEELNTLLSLFHTSELDSKVMAEICELLKRMEESRPQIDSLVILLMEKKDLDVGEEKTADEKNSDRNPNDDQVSKIEANPSNNGAAAAVCSQGKGKKKKNKSKPRKGKGGKR